MSNKHLNGYIDEDDRDYDSDAAHVHYPTCRFCGKQTIPVAPYPPKQYTTIKNLCQ